MKPNFNLTWLLVSIAIICNIFIFSYLSKNLESYVEKNVIDKETLKMY